jgi:hypothetical protein
MTRARDQASARGLPVPHDALVSSELIIDLYRSLVGDSGGNRDRDAVTVNGHGRSLP